MSLSENIEKNKIHFQTLKYKSTPSQFAVRFDYICVWINENGIIDNLKEYTLVNHAVRQLTIEYKYSNNN